jgi:hypothetical protein
MSTALAPLPALDSVHNSNELDPNFESMLRWFATQDGQTSSSSSPTQLQPTHGGLNGPGIPFPLLPPGPSPPQSPLTVDKDEEEFKFALGLAHQWMYSLE